MTGVQTCALPISVGRGTGLGMSVFYFIVVDDHGGEMTVSASPGQGTLFSVMLPLSCSDE